MHSNTKLPQIVATHMKNLTKHIQKWENLTNCRCRKMHTLSIGRVKKPMAMTHDTSSKMTTLNTEHHVTAIEAFDAKLLEVQQSHNTTA